MNAVSPMKLKIALSRDEAGTYVVECLNLPGCISQGRTRAEALENMRDAARGYLESLKKHNEKLPARPN